MAVGGHGRTVPMPAIELPPIEETDAVEAFTPAVALNVGESRKSRTTRREGVSGRLAFADDICKLHPGTLEQPCAKFGHLPGDGRGIVQPGILRQFRVFARVLIKPIFYVAIVFLAGSLLLGWARGTLRSNGLVSTPNGGVSIIDRPTPNGSISPHSTRESSLPSSRPSRATHIPTVTKK